MVQAGVYCRPLPRLGSRPFVLDDATKALVDRILSEPRPARARARKAPAPAECPESPQVVVHAPPETPRDLVEAAAACGEVEPAPAPVRPRHHAGAPDVVCILCSRTPAQEMLPLKSHRCSWCGFRGLLVSDHVAA